MQHLRNERLAAITTRNLAGQFRVIMVSIRPADKSEGAQSSLSLGPQSPQSLRGSFRKKLYTSSLHWGTVSDTLVAHHPAPICRAWRSDADFLLHNSCIVHPFKRGVLSTKENFAGKAVLIGELSNKRVVNSWVGRLKAYETYCDWSPLCVALSSRVWSCFLLVVWLRCLDLLARGIFVWHLANGSTVFDRGRQIWRELDTFITPMHLGKHPRSPAPRKHPLVPKSSI